MNIISFEGIEGVGKSTQINLLKEFLIKNNFTVEVLREPGSTSTGESIRNILLNKDSDISNKTELLLMFAARSELISKKIQTSSCDYLLLDRFFDASIAYQGYGRNLPITLIEDLIKFTDCPIPKLSILIDISVEEGFARKVNDIKDRIESSSLNFFNNVRNGYLEIAKKNENRFLVIDGSLSITEIHESIIKKLTI
ncbi:MAG: dTMP kinase [Gammaproteobacteria bacterium]